MVHKASEVAKHNKGDAQAQQAQAGHFAQDFKKEVENLSQQVISANKAEDAKVDKDGRNNSNPKQGKKDGKDKDKDEQDTKKPMFKNEQGRFSAKA